MKELRRLLKIPKVQLSEYLFLIFLSAFLFHPTLFIVKNFLLAVFATILADFIFLKVRKIKLFFPSAGLVSGLIIGLLSGPNLPWYVVFITGFLAMFSKHFIRTKSKHIFNPAAFGLFTSGLIFSNTVSWWAASWQQFRVQNLELIIGSIILLLPFFISAIRMCRYFTIFTFLIFYAIFIGRFEFDPTVIFFALVMLPEPMTSPSNRIEQMVFGLLIAAFSILNSRFLILNSLPDVLIFSLLVGNVIYFTYNYFMKGGDQK